MSEWIKLHAGVFTHPKTRRLAKRLQVPAAAAAGHMACLWSFTAEFAPDGDLSRFDVEEVELGAGWDGDDGAFVAAATASGYLDNGSGRLSVHDWADWGGKMVERKASERKRSADRRASAGRTEGGHSTTAGRPLAEREREREKERTPPTPPAESDPVDNSADQERDVASDLQEPGAAPPLATNPQDEPEPSESQAANCGESCDGRECLVREFPASAYGPLRRAMLASLKPEQFKEVGTGGEMDALLAEYAGHVCAACQAGLAEYRRPQLDGICEKAVVASVEGLKGSTDVKAVMRSRLQRFGLAELVGDRVLEELRRTKRDRQRKGEPRVLAACIPEIPEATEVAS